MGMVSRLFLRCFPVSVVCTYNEEVAWNILVIIGRPKSETNTYGHRRAAQVRFQWAAAGSSPDRRVFLHGHVLLLLPRHFSRIRRSKFMV